MTDNTLRALLLAIDDSDCRAILGAIDGESKAVKKLSEECDVPLSTAYRKVNRLHEAGLVEEKIRLSGSGNHTSVYEQSFSGALITLTDDGEFEVELVDPARESEPAVRSRVTA
jgi:predicted transcriptional regulator